MLSRGSVALAAALFLLTAAGGAAAEGMSGSAGETHAPPDLAVPSVTLPEAVTTEETGSPAAPPVSPPPAVPLGQAPSVRFAIRQLDSPPQFRRIVTQGDWSFDCISDRPDSLGSCTAGRDLVSLDGTEIIAALRIRGVVTEGLWHQDGGIEVSVLPPVGIADGVRLTAATGQVLTAPFASCDPSRCVARIELPEDHVQQLVKGGHATLIWAAPDGRTGEAGFSTRGLGIVLGLQ